MRRKRLSIPSAILLASLILSAAIIYAAWMIAEQGGAGYAGRRVAVSPVPVPVRTEVQVPASPEAQPVQPSGVAVGPDTPLKVGDIVLAPDQDRWWRADVLALEEGGRVRVHYRGWPSTWDRTIARAQLQVDVRGPRDKD
jgi:hypothetical protein